MQKRIVTIQDISCFGRCSLTVALPLLSAMGIETVVLPTAVLSTHTGGFTGFTFHDLTQNIPPVIAHWASLGLTFDGIYTGYLGSTQQVELVCDFIDRFRTPATRVIVDPAFGDAGRLYTGFDLEFVREMRRLCGKADVICPNLTEAAFLLEEDYEPNMTPQQTEALLERLCQLGCAQTVLTGVRSDDQHGAACIDAQSHKISYAFRPHIEQAMHGTGDIFASVLSGALLRGASLEKATEIAVCFTADTMFATLDDFHQLSGERAPWYGVQFEKCIGRLITYTKSISEPGDF